MDLKKLIAKLKAEHWIIEAEGKWPRIHAGVLEPPQGPPRPLLHFHDHHRVIGHAGIPLHVRVPA
jgi:hypothetical protein